MIVLTGETRLRKLDRHLRGVPNGAPVVVALTNLDAHRAELEAAGFTSALDVGETVLPKPAGKVSKYNADGMEIIHKDQPKETVYYPQEHTWEEWHGRDRVTQSRIVDFSYERYPRSFVEPPSIELTVAEDADATKAVVTTAVAYDDEHQDELLHRVNLFRELFGEAAILTEDLEPFTRTKVRRLNWEVLPPGEMPWERLKSRLEPILDQLGERVGPAVEERLRLLTSTYKPDFTAVGHGGFTGYVVYGYEGKKLFVVESLLYGNATYVFGQDWKRLSQLTKAEILREDLHQDRVIHRQNWPTEMRRVLGKS